MDLDLDLDTDRISDFLRSKLQEIKSANVQLEKSLHHRQKVAARYREEIAKDNVCDDVEICGVSKRLHHDKYVLGVGVRNESDSDLEDVNVILDWDSASPLNYKFHLISANFMTDGLRWTNHLGKSGQIIIIFDAPLFVDQLAYAVTCSINFRRNRKKITRKLPSTIQLTSQDITDNSTIVQMYRMIDGSIDDFLACAHTGEKHEFVMLIPTNWGRLLETTLEVDCSLRKLNITSDRKYFVAHKLSPALEGALLEIENDEFSKTAHLNTYCKDQNVVIALIHYLHRHIIDVVIIPKPLYQPDSSLLESIRNSLFEEVDRLEGFAGGDLAALRHKMADLEQRSDVLMSRFNEETK